MEPLRDPNPSDILEVRTPPWWVQWLLSEPALPQAPSQLFHRSRRVACGICCCCGAGGISSPHPAQTARQTPAAVGGLGWG